MFLSDRCGCGGVSSDETQTTFLSLIKNPPSKEHHSSTLHFFPFLFSPLYICPDNSEGGKRKKTLKRCRRFVAVLFSREGEQDGTTNNKVHVIICGSHLNGLYCTDIAINLGFSFDGNLPQKKLRIFRIKEQLIVQDIMSQY